MQLYTPLLSKAPHADVTLEWLDFTVNLLHVLVEVIPFRKFSAANLTRILGVRMLGSHRHSTRNDSLRVRRVTDSAAR